MADHPSSLLLFAAAWWAITVALSRLSRIGRNLANRNVDSLAPIADDHLPLEVALLKTELNSLLARMEQALLSQKRVVVDAAHELRTPVTALSLQVEQLLVLARQAPLLQTKQETTISLP